MRIVLVCSLLLSLVYGQTLYTWVGGASCNTGDVWSYNSTATCWNPPGIPSTPDTVLIPFGSSVTLNGTSGQPNINNFYTVFEPFGYVQRAAYTAVLVEGTLYINATIVLATSSSFTIYKGGVVQIQGLLGAIDGNGELQVDGTLNINQGIIMGGGPTTINAGALLNITSNHYGGEAYIMRNIDIFGTVTVNPGSVVHWGFFWQNKYLAFNINYGGNFTIDGFFSKFFEGTQSSWALYPNPNPTFPATINIYSGGILQINGFPHLYHPEIINHGGVMVSKYYGYNAPCSENVICFPYGLNYTDTLTSSYSCSWDCLFPYYCPSTSAVHIYANENIEIPPRKSTYEITDESMMEAKTCEDILSCRDSDICETLRIDLSEFGTHLHCGEHLQFSRKTIIFSNTDEIVVADDITFNDCSVVSNNVLLYFSREIHSLGSTFTTTESGEMIFIYLPTSGSSVDAVSYPYYFTNQHFYWEDAFERITLTDTILHGDMTFVSPARVYGSSGLLIQSDSNIFVERELKSTSFAGTGNIVIEQEATLTVGIEVGIFGDAIIDVFGILQVNGFSTVTSERLIRLHEGAVLNIAGELTSNIDLSECAGAKDFITAISDQVLQC